MILLHALLLRRRTPATARGFALGAAILAVSLSFRSMDGAVYAALPVGTHWVWRLLNAFMLAWMIEVPGRHPRALAGQGVAR